MSMFHSRKVLWYYFLALSLSAVLCRKIPVVLNLYCMFLAFTCFFDVTFSFNFSYEVIRALSKLDLAESKVNRLKYSYKRRLRLLALEWRKRKLRMKVFFACSFWYCSRVSLRGLSFYLYVFLLFVAFLSRLIISLFMHIAALKRYCVFVLNKERKIFCMTEHFYLWSLSLSFSYFLSISRTPSYLSAFHLPFSFFTLPTVPVSTWLFRWFLFASDCPAVRTCFHASLCS